MKSHQKMSSLLPRRLLPPPRKLRAQMTRKRRTRMRLRLKRKDPLLMKTKTRKNFSLATLPSLLLSIALEVLLASSERLPTSSSLRLPMADLRVSPLLSSPHTRMLRRLATA